MQINKLFMNNQNVCSSRIRTLKEVHAHLCGPSRAGPFRVVWHRVVSFRVVPCRVVWHQWSRVMSCGISGVASIKHLSCTSLSSSGKQRRRVVSLETAKVKLNNNSHDVIEDLEPKIRMDAFWISEKTLLSIILTAEKQARVYSVLL